MPLLYRKTGRNGEKEVQSSELKVQRGEVDSEFGVGKHEQFRVQS
jgi:hypothetical protein